MVMRALRDGAKGGVSKFILFGFMVLATGGLMMTDVGGFFRGGSVSGSDAAKVGKQTISIQNFDRTARRTLQQLGLSTQEAYKAGYINQLLNNEIRGYLLQNSAAKHDVKIADKHVAERIQQIIAPFTTQGENPQNVLDRLLLSQGLSERSFVAGIARDMSNSLLSDSIQNGVAYPSENIVADVLRYQQETRDIEYIAFMNDDMKDVPAPDDAQLQTLYDKTKQSFAVPETRRLKIITVKSEALKDTLEISEEEVRATYDNDIDLYTARASRTLAQGLLSTEEQALSVIKAVKGGQSLEEVIRTVIGNTSPYLGERAIEDENLIEEIKESVMAAEKPDSVLGPISSPLGYYVVVVKRINKKRVKAFETVRKEIKDELIDNALIDEQYAAANLVDDLIASGVSLEEVAEEVDIEIQTLPALNQYGVDKDNKDALKNYTADRAEIIRSGFELSEGESSPVFESRAGKLMAVYVDAITPLSYRSFEDAKDELSKRWRADQKRVGTRVLAAQFLSKINTQKETLSDIAKAQAKTLHKKSGLKRDEDPAGALNQRSMANIFEAELGKAFIVEIDGGVAIAKVTDFSWPKDVAKQQDAYDSALKSYKESTRNEAISLYLLQQQEKTGAKINQALLEQTYGQDDQGY